MEALERIMRQVYQNSTTFQNMEDKKTEYKCLICRDTGWIQTETGTYKRCECYKKDYVKRLWEHFGVDPVEVKKINEYKPYDKVTKQAKEKAIEYIQGFDNIRATRENSIGFFGQAGAGKSHLVIGIGAALLNRECSPVHAVYMPYLESIRELKANVNDDEYYLKLSSRYKRADVLIIDDLFKDKVKKGRLNGELKEADIKHIYPIINYRYLNCLPTVISSECTPEMLLDLDEAIAGRILEACGDNMIVFIGANYDYRMRKFTKDI